MTNNSLEVFTRLRNRVNSDMDEAVRAASDTMRTRGALVPEQQVEAPLERESDSEVTGAENQRPAVEDLLDCALDAEHTVIRGRAWITLADIWRGDPSDALRDAIIEAVTKRYGPIFGDKAKNEHPDRIAHWWIETLALGLMTRRNLAQINNGDKTNEDTNP